MDIRTLSDDEPITEPGFYRISLDRHHAQPCLSAESRAALAEGVLPPINEVSVTSGILRKMELASPADVWAFHMLNPDRWEKADTDALRLGRAMAAFIEGGMEEVGRHYLILPADKPNRPTPQQRAAYDEGRATEAGTRSVEFWAKIEADPRTPLSDAEMKMIADMGKVLALDPAACAAMGGEPEITMAHQDQHTGLWLLSRPDAVSLEGAVVDYKKMSTQGRPFSYRVVDSRITEHGYDCQMAFAAEAIEALTGEWPGVVGIIAQWDQPPHHVILREILDEDLRFGQFRNRRAIARFAECYASGYWPGPGDDTAAYQRPDWQREMLLEQMNTAHQAP